MRSDLRVATSSMAMGTGNVDSTASFTSQGASVGSMRAELDSLIFSLTSPPKASPYSMDDKDPRKFFIPGERKWVMTKGMGRPPKGPDSVSSPPRLHWLRAPCPLPLRLQLSCAHQPGAAGIWTDVFRGQTPEGSQTSPSTF